MVKQRNVRVVTTAIYVLCKKLNNFLKARNLLMNQNFTEET